MTSDIERCIDLLSCSDSIKQGDWSFYGPTLKNMVERARVELANLQAEVEAVHKYQETVYRWMIPIVCLWQLETGNDDRWPDLVVLIDWLRARGDKARAVLSRLEDAAEAYTADQSYSNDSRLGMNQPITVAEGEELNAAVAAARAILEP